LEGWTPSLSRRARIDTLKKPVSPSVTILIVNYNGLNFVMNAIDSALGQRYDGPFEVVVVDNASTDGSLTLLRGISGIRVIESGLNGGFGAGVNVALPSLQTDYVAFLNPDAQAKPEWLSRIVPFMLNGNIALASSIISAGAETYFASGRYFAALGVSVDSHERRDETDWLTGCALVASLEAIKSLGGFDEGYFLYYEDVDLCLRARARGLRLKVLQEPLVDHPERGGSTNALGRRKMEIIYESRGRLIGKHVAVPLRLPALSAALALAAFRNGIPISWMMPITRALIRGFVASLRKSPPRRPVTAS
jgi:GT2 family glycosyltransferase